MPIERTVRRRDRRTLEWLVLSGVVLPLATVGVVRWAALAWRLSAGVVLLVLFGLPFLMAVALVGSGPWEAGPLGRAPDAGPERFRDRIPERYHEEFAAETLNDEVDEGSEPGPRHRFALVYSVMVPAVTFLVMIL